MPNGSRSCKRARDPSRPDDSRIKNLEFDPLTEQSLRSSQARLAGAITFTVILRDITARKRFEQTLQSRTAQGRRARAQADERLRHLRAFGQGSLFTPLIPEQ